MSCPTFTPDPLSEARATVLDPARVHLHPALMMDAWARLKEARGQRIARPHLLAPAHVIRTPGQVGTVAALDAARARVSERVRRLLGSGPHDGDAA